jgi:MYXO-CTERM domain-containing protein
VRTALAPALAFAACALVAPAALAQPSSSPPSKTLERAIKLYDKEDYYSASIELSKVTSGETGDDPPNVARAEFFTAKTLVRLGFHAAAQTWFQRTLPPHTYGVASAKWIVDQLEKMPNEGARTLLQSYSLQDFDDPSLSPENRAWIFYFRGHHVVRTTMVQAEAEHLLSRVPAGTPPWPRAQLALAELRFRLFETDGVAFAVAAAADPSIAVDAVRTMVFWTRMIKRPDAARDALAQLAAGTDAAAGVAALELSRLDAGKQLPALANTGVEAFEGAVLAAVCPTGRSDDAIAAAAPIAGHTVELIDKLLGYADHAETAHAARKVLAHPAGPADRVLAVLLSDPDSREILAWTNEIRAELQLVNDSDRAWQTTMVAAELVQELTIQGALADGEAGRRIRDRLTAVRPHLQMLSGLGDRKESMELSAGPAGSGATFIVTPALCAAALGIEPSVIADTGTIPTTVTPKPHGCGCATSSPAGALGALALLLAFLAARR